MLACVSVCANIAVFVSSVLFRVRLPLIAARLGGGSLPTGLDINLIKRSALCVPDPRADERITVCAGRPSDSAPRRRPADRLMDRGTVHS